METRKKKIIYVITKGGWGGAQRYVHDLTVNLDREVFTIHLVSGGDGELVRKLTAQGIFVHTLPSLVRDISLFSDIASCSALVKLFKKERPDIIHLNSSKAGFCGALAGRIAGVPKILFTAHGWAFNEERNWLVRLLMLKIHYLTVFMSHEIIAVSEKTKEQIAWLPFIQHKIHVIYNGIESPVFLEGREKVREMLSLPHDTTIIGTIAELHKNKGLSYALRALAGLKKKGLAFFFVIIGEGELRDELEKETRDLGIERLVSFEGARESAEQFLALGFDIFILPSITEALPYSLVEAGYAGLPTIASRVGGIPEIIENRKSGLLVAPRDVGGLQEALEEMLNHPEKRRHYGATLKKKVSSQFSLEKMLTETQRLYEHS